MMRKIITGFLSFFVLFFLLSSSVFSQEKMIYPYPPTTTGTGFLGQQHYYTITYRGNGEAVVAFKDIFTNTSPEVVTGVTFRLPAVVPRDLIAYQVIREPQCLRYKSSSTMMPVGEPANIQSDCAESQEPDYFQQWWYKTKYQKAAVSFSGDTITVNLPNAIAPEKSGSIILAYRAFGYAKKEIAGAYKYVFETLKVEFPISKLQVGVATDSDLVIKGTKSNVNYRFESGGTAMKAMDAAQVPVASNQLDTYYQEVGQGMVVKNASNLQPLESYTVKGVYASSVWRLYAKEALIILFLLLVLGGLIFLAIRKFMSSGSTVSKYVFAVAVGFAASILTLGYTLLLVLLMGNPQNIFPYLYGSSTMVLYMLLMIVSVGVYGLLLFVPGILIGFKRGLAAGIVTFVSTLCFLVFYLCVTLIFFLITNNSPITPPYQVVPMMKGAESGSVNSVRENLNPQ